MQKNKRLTLVEHLEELRSRLAKSAIFVVVASCLFYGVVGYILPHLTRPVGRLVFIAPHEAFVTNIKIAFFGGLFISLPFLILQIWQFVKSGLKTNEKNYVLLFGPLSFLFFLAGSAFGYFIIVPIGMKFLLSFSTDIVTPMIAISRYVSFLGVLTFAFGLVFELPLIVLFLTKIGITTPQFLAARRREAIVLIFISAAVLTPPDIITQCLMALPLLILYEIGIIFSKLAYRSKRGPDKAP
ncbi:MAG: twin-arginine translocase subunit TatC [Candidatus Omnitrophica bacterium]|nr:twin-arginine translocase subunit TatC [Candidatus Omnitrophota bacterium]